MPDELPCPVCGFIGGYHPESLHRPAPLLRRGWRRRMLYERDDYTCQRCGKQMTKNDPDITLDHVIPRSRGGMSTDDNLATLCRRCNTEKADRLP